jgi:hypothetical protein
MASRKPYPKRQYPNWAELDPSIDRLLAEGWTMEAIAKDLGVRAHTIREHRRKRKVTGTPTVHPDTPEHSGVPHEHLDPAESVHQETPKVHLSTPYEAEVLTGHHGTPEHLSTPERTKILPDEQYTQEDLEPPAHQGTLEGHQEVMEDISQSVPDAPHIGTERSLPVHPSTPEVHLELSPDDSSMAHPGVPARQNHYISTPMVHPGTPTEEDWMLWTAIKGRWSEIEKMLSDWQTRHTLLSTPSGTPRHTMKKTYVVDTLYIELIDRYAQEQGVELKDVVNLAFHEFFQRRDYLPEES